MASKTGVAPACQALNVSRATFYRHRTPRPKAPRPARRSPRALSDGERREVLEHLHSERFVDKAPSEVYATLLDEGRYYCSERTMYRILAANDEVRERRNQLRRPAYTKPELLATGPNQVWSWDITKLKRLISESCEKQGIEPGQLTLHADRGSSMKSKTVARLLGDLGVTKNHSRPHVSDDNPFSESQFKTLKYRPEFPNRFGSFEDALAFCRAFFQWYNTEHYHSGIGLLTPESVHFGQAEQVIRKRSQFLEAAYEAHPERFVRGRPAPPRLPEAAWINPPRRQPQSDEELH